MKLELELSIGEIGVYNDITIACYLVLYALISSVVEVPVGGYCMKSKQCQGGANSALCENKRCVCKPGYFLFHLGCYEGKLEMIFKKYILV